MSCSYRSCCRLVSLSFSQRVTVDPGVACWIFTFSAVLRLLFITLSLSLSLYPSVSASVCLPKLTRSGHIVQGVGLSLI